VSDEDDFDALGMAVEVVFYLLEGGGDGIVFASRPMRHRGRGKVKGCDCKPVEFCNLHHALNVNRGH